MNRFSIVAVFLTVLTFGFMEVGMAQPAEKDQAETVKKAVIEMVEATRDGNYEKVVDLTYETIVEQGGGREKVHQAIKQQMDLMKADGMKMIKYKIGEPESFASTADNQFVLVPQQLVFTIRDLTIQTDSHVLGISSDLGKTWKFLTIPNEISEEYRSTILPSLPENYELPKATQPKITRNDIQE